jgi:hypothetical protein
MSPLQAEVIYIVHAIEYILDIAFWGGECGDVLAGF